MSAPTQRLWPTVRSMLIGTLLIAAMIVGPDLYGAATSSQRIAPEVEAVAGPVNVRIVLPFTPLPFHQEVLGAMGVFGGSSKHAIVLYNVQPPAIAKMKRIYWIDRVVLADSR